MSPSVKRSYESPLRREQATRTRAGILRAAAELFRARGYGSTTIRQVAEAAGVAPDTVYAVFGTKARLLTALIDDRLAPEGEQNVLDRSEALAVRDEPDQRRQVARFARDIADLSFRVRPVFEILRTAAAAEPEIGPVYAEMESARARNMHQVAEWIAANGPLRVSTDRAGDVIWALASPDVARLLCDVRGWSSDEYAAWLAESLERLLLPGESDPGPARPRPARRRSATQEG